eukprot:11764-Eustigmatos_ZCMA.PRE.1
MLLSSTPSLKRQLAPGRKFSPRTATVVPPVIAPRDGLTDHTTGSCRYVKRPWPLSTPPESATETTTSVSPPVAG